MVRIEETVVINAPIDTVFDAERNISLHEATQKHRAERAVAGVTSGLIENGQEVEWEAVHFGIKQRLRVRITHMTRPIYFRDEMVSGAFRSFSHEHFFRALETSRTEKKDVMLIEAPLGLLGRLAEVVFLSGYMRRFLRKKNAQLKQIVEGMMLKGNRVLLREAEGRDQRRVYEWLAHSDLTPSMMGPPSFPDHPIPTWEEFCADYRPHYFDESNPSQGRCFVIVVEDTDVGGVCYNAIDRANGRTDVDIWLRSESDCGKGYGSDALRTLGNFLHAQFGIEQLVVSPSARNRRAIAAYQKAGFRPVPRENYRLYVRPEELEYTDNVVLVKEIAQNNAMQPTSRSMV